MKSLPEILHTLQASRYLKGCCVARSETITSLEQIELLSNGKRFCEQLQRYWQDTNYNMPIYFAEGYQEANTSAHSRLDFIYSQRFRKNINLLKANMNSAAGQCPAVIKSRFCAKPNNSVDTLLKFSPSSDGLTQLITDFFVHSASGLEKFYNIQRERKIWWMRFSANPSRYFVEPYNLSNIEKNIPNSCQSITIKSRFPFGATNVEQVTLLHLREAKLEETEDFQLHDKRSERFELPAVIRSVIDLEAAACSMLFDGNDHNRNATLLLNRHLTPFQCTLACIHNDKSLSDLRDLCSHLSFVICRAGLKLYTKNTVFSNCKDQLKTALINADSIGIPYALLITEDTLFTGLLKLRNRDTTLEETIHISDIPTYLLNIFTKIKL